MTSNLDRSAAGRLIFSTGDSLGLYRPYRGLAAANMDVRAFKVVVMPAFEIDIVCCSITSWIAVRSDSSILSNSSIQHIPLSANTSAPPSFGRSGTATIKGAVELTEHHLVGYRIAHYSRSKTNPRRPFSSCVDPPRCNFGNVFE